MTPGSFNDWTIAILSPLPRWLLAVLLLALASAVVAAHLGLKRERRRWRRWLLTSLRTVAAVAAAVLLLEPAVQLLQVHRVKNRVDVLLDTSESMGLPGPDGKTRLEDAQALLHDDAYFQNLSDRFVFEFSTFDSTTYPSDRAHLEQAKATGSHTDILEALRSAGSGTGPAGGRRLAGIILLTDGADTASLSQGMTPAAKATLARLRAPVHAFVAGEAKDVRDLAVTHVAADDFAFVRNAISVEATVRDEGFEAQDLPVTLRREGRVVSSQTVHLTPGKPAEVTFRFTPDTTGKFIYTVSVPVLDGESVTTNNRRSFVLKVIRDRIRVLQVAGRPSWDERFLRGLLKKDPNVDLISFFILRTPEDSTAVPQNDLSLIPFPTDELFTKELKTFDLVIFQNFNYGPYDMAQYLDNIKEYVEGGGSFVMIGGEKSFSSGRYQGTYIEDILPVDLLPQTTGTISQDPFKPRLTEAGRRSPIMQVGSSPQDTDKIFASMPALDGVNEVARVKPDAQVLLEDPFLKTVDGGHNAPVIATREVGRGRTMAVLTDSTWFWSFPAAGMGDDRRAYDRFWTNAMRWLIRDPDLTNVRVRPTKDAYEPGEPVVLDVSVRDKNYGPGVGADVTVHVTAADGSDVGTFKAVAGDDGVATVRLDLGGKKGAFKVSAVATDPKDNGTMLGKESGSFLVRATSAEMVSPAPRPKLLQAIADVTGGSVHTLPRSSFPDLSFVDPKVVEVGRKKNVDLWDRWWFLAVLIGAAALEWALRRRWGLL